MRRLIIFCILNIFLNINMFSQNKKDSNLVNIDTIIPIEEVFVYAKQKNKVIETYGKEIIRVRGKGKTSIVSKVHLEKELIYKIKAIEFFFNYKWLKISNEGFYIKPLIISSINGVPHSNILNSPKLYYIGNNINENLYIDISDNDVVLKNVDSFFVGIEFTEECDDSNFEEFNVTMILQKKVFNTSYIKGGCNSCEYSPFNLDDKNGLTLKYKIYYN